MFYSEYVEIIKNSYGILQNIYEWLLLDQLFDKTHTGGCICFTSNLLFYTVKKYSGTRMVVTTFPYPYEAIVIKKTIRDDDRTSFQYSEFSIFFSFAKQILILTFTFLNKIYLILLHLNPHLSELFI